jgi:hypothetical protein
VCRYGLGENPAARDYLRERTIAYFKKKDEK